MQCNFNDINELQLKCLEIMKEIHKICEKNNIKYSLCGGSVIGSYLYEGFIPWDDDIDIMMTRENYDKFIEVFQSQSNNKYKLINYKTTEKVQVLYSKVEDTSTTIIEKYGGKLIKSGIFIDITVFDYVPNKIKHIISCLLQRYMEVYLYKGMDANHKNKYKEKLYNAIYFDFISRRREKMYLWYENFCKKSQKSQKCAELLTLNLGKITYPSKLFDSYILVDFEDTKFYIVEDYVEYLYFRYGKRNKEDFIIDPKEGKLDQHQVYFDVNIPYSEFKIDRNLGKNYF